MATSQPTASNPMHELGRIARREGADFLDNPAIQQAAEWADDEFRWAIEGNAWSAGWLEEDAGRTEWVQRHLRAEVPRLFR